MNFEERKAEILRRSRQRIAARKRKMRIILATVLPIALVAVLALPVSRMLSSKQEDASEHMYSRFPSSTQVLGATMPESMEVSKELADAYPSDKKQEMLPQEDATATAPAFSYCAPVISGPAYSSDYGNDPPAITVTTTEGLVAYPAIASQCWPKWVDGQVVYSVPKALNVLAPGAVNVQIVTADSTLILDVLMPSPEEIWVQCWPISQIGNTDAPAQGAIITALTPQDTPQLYRLHLYTGSYVYRVQIRWADASASYAFIATAE